MNQKKQPHNNIMYPDLNNIDNYDNNDSDDVSYITSQNKFNKDTQARTQGEACCAVCAIMAKVLVCITGISGTLTGLFAMSITLYTLVGGHDYGKLSELFPTFTISMIFCVGILLAFCSVVLIVATCCYTNPRFRVAIIIFSVLLTIILLIELAIGAFAVWSLDIIAIPKDNPQNVVTDQLLMRRNQIANATYIQCCVDSTPPYFGGNATLVDGICKWPESTQQIKDDCGDTNVFVCVCGHGPKQYTAFFGIFLRHCLSWIAGAMFVSAGLLLVTKIALCFLICQKEKTDSHPYIDGRRDKHIGGKRQSLYYDADAFSC